MKRWIPHRVGLVNYWYYDEEEFEFSGGKLLLRGGNGSGKSVTMQSLIPLLLDGNKSPERLDPFGSRARQMQDYLLGEEERSLEQRTGYLFMEFQRKPAEQFLTIGLGLYARRHRPVDSWGFAITDGRRIGSDLQLYKSAFLEDGRGAKLPISKRELQELLGEGGVYCSGQGEYMALVNQLLFGFHSLEEYDELIKLLIQLRSPKLSKDFRPNVLYGIMNSSLQALSDEDLRPLTETIENMDQMRIQLSELRRNHRAAHKIQGEYSKYNRAVLYNKAIQWQNAGTDLTQREMAIRDSEALLRREREEAFNLGLEISRLEQERAALETKELELRDDDAFRLEERYQTQLRRREELGQELRRKQGNLTQKIAREKDLEKQAEVSKWQNECLEKTLEEMLIEMKTVAEGAFFEDHLFTLGDLRKLWGTPFDFSAWGRDGKRYQARLRETRSALEEEQRAVRRYDELLADQDQYSKEQAQAERRREELHLALGEARQEYLAALASWYLQNERLLLQEEQRYLFHQLVLKFGEGTGRADLEKYLYQVSQKFDQELLAQIIAVKQEIQNLEEEREELDQELRLWQSKEEPEPERDPQIEATRKLLAQAGILCFPFYELLEFKPDLTSAQRGMLETAFVDLGILDALIVEEKQLVKAKEILGQGADKILMAASATKSGGPNLNQILQVACPPGPLGAQVERILAGFSLDETAQWSIGEDGSFSFGKLTGRARQGLPSRFIGVESRRRFREEKIDELEQGITLLTERLLETEKSLRNKEAARERLQWELESMPATDVLQKRAKAWDAMAREVLVLTERLEKHSLLVQKQFNKVQEERNHVRKKAKGLGLPLSLAKFQAAEEEMQEYSVMLALLQGEYSRWLALKDQCASLQDNLVLLQEDVDLLKGELNTAELELAGCLRLVRELQSLRQRSEFIKLQKETEKIIRRLKEIPEEVKNKAARQGHLQGHLIGITRELEIYRAELEKDQQRLKRAEEELRYEVNLGFPLRLQGETPEQWVAEIFALFDKEEAVKDFDESILTRRLQEAVYAGRTDLLDYGLSISELGPRLAVIARLEGRSVSLYQLTQWLDGEISRCEMLLDETDRELFEEIILQTVGQKIRTRIYRAEEWVRNMNNLMAERDTTSGLTLHLRWQPKPAETEEELGTRELVEILKTDVTILSEEVFNQVTAHFRSKVERARARLEEQDFHQSFHQTVREILDYREWFEFRLFFQKTGETRRELTNRAFDRLSGGEKAMAMYIPLFSSVYSRYQGARPDAPRLISLDEAFAGVDDSNIRDMFELMEQLGFNYIINSQILWGDYDTVPELSICELVRPKNADHVSVIRYLWDGKVRSLLTTAG